MAWCVSHEDIVRINVFLVDMLDLRQIKQCQSKLAFHIVMGLSCSKIVYGFFRQSAPTGRPILFIAAGKRYMRPLLQGPGWLLCSHAQPSPIFSWNCASTVPVSCFDIHAAVLEARCRKQHPDITT